ncbi:MAG: L-seryl-tRNA(Sec) selenium transferase [Cyanobacteria bacterium SZAS LIN-2]|nr:L-seryl-tRNA(Sec) selenium transferase [Cyanobacteria bacterium SZAS LIN-2]MBS2009854.1 L-seryl-tRNA(Sec) selenium transferase [Cyanobacteria bacterium SZAS TMP-1]
MENAVIRLPQVDKILREPVLEALATTVRRDVIATVVRAELAKRRQNALNNDIKVSYEKGQTDSVSAGEIAECVKSTIETLLGGGIRRVVNGTGVILSTNLGRAPIDSTSAERLSRALSAYCNLEFDLADGERGERTAELSDLLQVLIGCQSAIVVNNCAAAVMLAVQAMAAGKEVIVSRGELIEIGGSFRLPDVIKASGAILKEVGTTNRTRIEDYSEAISANTGLIIKCHKSNYQIVGFTEEASLAQLVALSQKSKIPLAYDLGGGCLVDLARFELAPEPTVQETLAAGVDLVMFSGDKLLGGPQAGIIVGHAEPVARLRRCPTYRALRADKLVLALLETVAAQYLLVDGPDRLPVFAMAGLKPEVIRQRVNLFIDKHQPKLDHLTLGLKETQSTMGGGSLPGETLASFALSLSPSAKNGSLSESRLARLLRAGDPPIIATVSAGHVLLDFRTLMPGDEDDLARALSDINNSAQSKRL